MDDGDLRQGYRICGSNGGINMARITIYGSGGCKFDVDQVEQIEIGNIKLDVSSFEAKESINEDCDCKYLPDYYHNLKVNCKKCK